MSRIIWILLNTENSTFYACGVFVPAVWIFRWRAYCTLLNIQQFFPHIFMIWITFDRIESFICFPSPFHFFSILLVCNLTLSFLHCFFLYGDWVSMGRRIMGLSMHIHYVWLCGVLVDFSSMCSFRRWSFDWNIWPYIFGINFVTCHWICVFSVFRIMIATVFNFDMIRMLSLVFFIILSICIWFLILLSIIILCFLWIATLLRLPPFWAKWLSRTLKRLWTIELRYSSQGRALSVFDLNWTIYSDVLVNPLLLKEILGENLIDGELKHVFHHPWQYVFQKLWWFFQAWICVNFNQPCVEVLI